MFQRANHDQLRPGAKRAMALSSHSKPKPGKLNSIRTFRDKQVAHWGQMKTQGPIINDIFAMSRETATAIELLAQGTGVVSLTVNSQLMGYRDKADRFWGK
jgi:hypothetical protein